MAGLLDLFDNGDAQLGLGLLAAASPRADGAGFGQRLMEGVGSAQQMRQAQAQRKVQDLQMQKAQMEFEQQKKMQEAAGKFIIPAQPGLAPIAGDTSTGIPPSAGREAVPAGYDYSGYANWLAANGAPDKALAIQSSLIKETPFNKVDTDKFTPESLAEFQRTRNYGALKPRDKLEFVEGVGVNPYDPENAGRAVPNPNKPFSLSPTGAVVPNTAYQEYELGKAKAGAANTSVKVENKMGESLAGQVGPMVKDTYSAANGAVQQVDAANRIVKAIDSGKIIAGPLANARMTAAQIGQMLGVTGKDEAETIARSRDVIRGLSEMTLQGRKQMTGQGAITESEGKLAEKAMSGDISSLTPAEIRQLALASTRAAKFTYQQHQNNIANMKADPSTAGLAKFYNPMPMPATSFDSPSPSAAKGGVTFLGFE